MMNLLSMLNSLPEDDLDGHLSIRRSCASAPANVHLGCFMDESFVLISIRQKQLNALASLQLTPSKAIELSRLLAVAANSMTERPLEQKS